MPQRDGLPPAVWPNGQTIAIVGTVLTVGVGIGAMVFSSTSSIRGEVRGLATKLENTHRSLAAEIKATRLELRDEIRGIDTRVRVVEQTVAGIEGRLSAKHSATQRSSPLDHAEDDA